MLFLLALFTHNYIVTYIQYLDLIEAFSFEYAFRTVSFSYTLVLGSLSSELFRIYFTCSNHYSKRTKPKNSEGLMISLSKFQIIVPDSRVLNVLNKTNSRCNRLGIYIIINSSIIFFIIFFPTIDQRTLSFTSSSTTTFVAKNVFKQLVENNVPAK